MVMKAQQAHGDSHESSLYGIKVEELTAMNSEKDMEALASFDGAEGLAKLLHTDLHAGLDPRSTGAGSIQTHMEVFGPNKYKETPPKPLYKIMWENLQDPILILLIVAASLSTILGAAVPEEREHGAYVDGIAIWGAVIVVNLVGSVNDYQKDQQFRKLNAQKDSIFVTVIRGKEKTLVKNFEVVVGDLLCLDTGNKVVADGIAIESQSLTLDEASLTGESDPIKKLPWGKDHPNADPWVRSGTQVSEGSGMILVLAVGVNSEWGKTLTLVANAGDDETPLQRKLGDVAGAIGKIGFGVAICCFIAMLVKWCVENNGFPIDRINDNGPVQFFLYAVTIIVVAVPEGLPLAVTISLAYAMKKMMKDQNFVRVLAACETMGGATTICSDKTGTLTENRMSVTEGWFAGHKLAQAPTKEELRPELLENLKINIAMSSKAFIIDKGADKMEFVGNRTECALLLLTRNWGTNITALQEDYHDKMVKLWGFSSARKMSSVVIQHPDKFRLYNKGAAEWVLQRCTNVCTEYGDVAPMTPQKIEELEAVVKNMASRGLRCICLTYTDFPLTTERAYFDEAEDLAHNLTCMAIVGIKDPVRKEVPAAVETCKRAGIIVRMVTGDNIDTACHIARECGILYDEDHIAMQGKDFRVLATQEEPSAEFIASLPRLRVLARSSPEDKLTLVALLKKQGDVVAVTGDGTNDAPALKESDVGLAMGIAGTEVAKEAADIVILDDNFSSIVKSVLWGRSVFNSIRKFLQFQLTVNFVALVIAFVGAVAGGIKPLNVLQLLWVNLIMDTMGALALATEDPNPELLNEKPYGREEPLITKRMMKHVLVQGLYQMLWMFLCVYALPGLDRYHVSSKEEFYHEKCASQVSKSFKHFSGPNVTYYCNVMTECGFPYGRDTADTPACVLWSSIPNTTIYGRPSVPTNMNLAVCNNQTHCPIAGNINAAIKKMDRELIKEQEYDYRRALSVLFNAFIMAQIMNEFNSRRLKDEYTIFEGVLKSPIFVGVIIITLGFQVIIMQTPVGVLFKVIPLDWREWLATIAIGLGAYPISLLTRFTTRVFFEKEKKK